MLVDVHAFHIEAWQPVLSLALPWNDEENMRFSLAHVKLWVRGQTYEAIPHGEGARAKCVSYAGDPHVLPMLQGRSAAAGAKCRHGNDLLEPGWNGSTCLLLAAAIVALDRDAFQAGATLQRAHHVQKTCTSDSTASAGQLERELISRCLEDLDSDTHNAVPCSMLSTLITLKPCLM